ncbi:hypothetical protein AGR7A_Cc210068 [Agrobacterium deltaense NCPPB 1641]|uniref:Uncharacterized protein n=1 Tax=Agrobacterium deltaense NCPPB 1641 TaxID=1183425 RepID=A0A1S7TLS8_9HYPH|nr:hypothetical protein AGR7A_Cc210068 [Agrobacterium deltaense NCPPB 1641]
MSFSRSVLGGSDLRRARRSPGNGYRSRETWKTRLKGLVFFCFYTKNPAPPLYSGKIMAVNQAPSTFLLCARQI